MPAASHAPKKKPPTSSNRQARPATAAQRLLTLHQIEQEFGIPYRSLYDMHVRGTLKAIRFPGFHRLWFERAAIEKLIADSAEAGRAPGR